ncbi:hypothetical protein Cgig2_013128 [Carnegiea gigantea]|uniref:RNase H type-1 domain-containing protein n=1 Tax=Carnegiea gigantea TaxID=171969 RepID=A0A9Q1KR66_9CARY|nr:hypothetical protein Cgig2_013128 [Carnegiea gigantea]
MAIYGSYGFPEGYMKLKTCDLIADLYLHHCFMPWLVSGDWNEVFFNYEKRDGPLKSQSVLEVFRDTLNTFDLHDLGYLGLPFICWNLVEDLRRSGGGGAGAEGTETAVSSGERGGTIGLQCGTELKESGTCKESCLTKVSEEDLGREIIDELQAGPKCCRSHLRGTISDVKDLLAWKRTVTFNHAKRPINLVAAVLAFSQKEQTDALVIHSEPPSSIQLALNLDKEIYLFAQRLQDEERSQMDHA